MLDPVYIYVIFYESGRVGGQSGILRSEGFFMSREHAERRVKVISEAMGPHYRVVRMREEG